MGTQGQPAAARDEVNQGLLDRPETPGDPTAETRQKRPVYMVISLHVFLKRSNGLAAAESWPDL